MVKLNRRAWVGIMVAAVGIIATTYVIRRFAVVSPIVECRITLGISNRNGNVEMILTNREEIQSLLEKPLNAAVENREPSRYPIIGSLQFTREDGSKGGFIIFEGWFCVKQGDTYLNAELGPLREYVRKILKGWSERLR